MASLTTEAARADTAVTQAPRRSGWSRVGSFNWLGLGTVVALVLLWQLLVGTGAVSRSALPSPTDIWHGFGYLVGPDAGGALRIAVLHTVRVVLEAWAISTVLGGILGFLLALSPVVASWTSATVDLLRSLPVVALIPIAILIWGTGDKTEIILGAYSGIWAMLINTGAGVRNVPARLRDVARTLQLSRGATLVKVVMPATWAAMLVGARLALSSTLVICVVSEMLGLQSGVGNQLVLEQSGMEPARMWVYILIAGILGILVNTGLVRLFRVLLPGVAAVAERNAR